MTHRAITVINHLPLLCKVVSKRKVCRTRKSADTMVKHTRAAQLGSLYFWGLGKNSSEKQWFLANCTSIDKDGHVAFPEKIPVAPAQGRKSLHVLQIACESALFACVTSKPDRSGTKLWFGARQNACLRRRNRVSLGRASCCTMLASSSFVFMQK